MSKPIKSYDLYLMTVQPPLEVIGFLQDHGLISRSFVCPECGKHMVLDADESISDKYCWRCSACKTVKSVRTGSWLSELDVPMVQILLLTYFWIRKYPQNSVEWEIGVSGQTTVDWNNFCRELCVEIVLGERAKIGGPGITVEIDESEFRKRKYRRGKHVGGQWVFGGIERRTNRCFLTTVRDRSSETLISLIEEFIAPGTTIIINCWKPYERLGEEGCKHLESNHSITFKNPVTGACKNPAKCLWTCVKRQMPNGDRSNEPFPYYLGEFMWRRLRKGSSDLFASFLQGIARIYPPPTNQIDADEDADTASESDVRGNDLDS